MSYEKVIRSYYLGQLAYDNAHHLQRELWAKRVAGQIPDQLLLLQHPPAITLGRNALTDKNVCPTRISKHVLASKERLERLGVQLVETDRGGDVTYHGPGQLVGYPIIDLKPDRMDVLRYLRDLETVLIRTLEEFGIRARRRDGYTGVWVEDRKIASIGVKISRWVTYHGFALNVNTDLSAFDLIVPCGIQGVRVTSMKEELNREFDVVEVARATAREMGNMFGLRKHFTPVADQVEIKRAKDGSNAPVPQICQLTGV